MILIIFFCSLVIDSNLDSPYHIAVLKIGVNQRVIEGS